MCTTSVVLTLLTTVLCCQASHGNATFYRAKPITSTTQRNAFSPHGLPVGIPDNTTKHFVLKNVIATASGHKNGLTVPGVITLNKHSSNKSNGNNLQHIVTRKQHSMNYEVRGDAQADLSLNSVSKPLSKDIKNYANTQTIIGNNQIVKHAQSGHRNYDTKLSSSVRHNTLPGKSTAKAPGKSASLLESGPKAGTSPKNQSSFINLKGEHRQPKLGDKFDKNNKIISSRLTKKHTRRRHIKGSVKKTKKQNNVLSQENNGLDNVHVANKKHQHHHHHHRHHHRRHRHHRYEQGMSSKKKQQGGVKQNGGYRLAPPMMVTPKPTTTKQQPKIFKTNKHVTYTGHDQQAAKRFVILGGPQGLHHLNRFHFSPALVNALKLVLNKKNSFKKDADILNLAKALETKDTNNNVPKNSSITTAVSNGKTQNGQPARLVTVKDPGYVNPKGKKGDLQEHHDKGPAITTTQINALQHDKKPLPNNVQGLNQAIEAQQKKGTRKTTGNTISKEPAYQVLGQAAYRSKISDDHTHSTLVDPTSLGVSILKLLFGKRAELVVKPKFKMLINGRPDLKYLQGYGTRKQRNDLQKEIEEDNKLMLLKGSKKEVFEATLAKSISNLITALNKNDKTTSPETKPNQNQKTTKAIDQSETTTQKDSKVNHNKTNEQQGTRKSWVLLKMPKTGEKEDENVEKYADKDDELRQNAIKLIATVGKHNNKLSDLMESKSHKVLDDDMMDSIKKPKESEEGTPSKEVSPISYNLSGIKSKNELAKTSSTSDASSVETTLSKILKGIQESIKELKEQRKEPPPDNKIRVTSYPSHTALKSSDTSPMPFTSSDTSRASAVAKIPDLLAAVNNLLGAENHKSPVGLPGLPSDETASAVRNPSINVPTSDASQSDAARRFVSNARATNDPLLPKPDMYDEPITTVSHAKAPHGQGPSDNVLFESDEMASQRDEQNSIAAMKLKEDLESFAEKGLNAHNKYRAMHHSPNLIWSDVLATQAEKLAYEMAMKGTIEKSSLATSLNYGENVAKISGATFNRAGDEATSLWYSEISNYSFSDPRITPRTDSFTQVVWKSSTKLGMGCARDLQTNDLYVVALYDPKGNDESGLRSNVLNKGQLTEDVYASIFKRHKLKSSA